MITAKYIYFLNLLYWLEALSLIGIVSESIYMIANLQSMLTVRGFSDS